MSEIVVSEFMDRAAIEYLSVEFDVLFDPTLVDDPRRLATELAAARALIVRNGTQVCESLLRQSRRLEVIGRLGVGLDNIDLDACKRRGIEVLAAVGANASAVAEYVIAGALLLFRGAFLATARVADGSWPRQQLVGREISGKTIGFVGFGATAQAVAQRAIGLGMRGIAYDPYVPHSDRRWRELGVKPTDLTSVIRRSDLVSLHTPLNEETHHLLNAERLGQMKVDAVLINAGRGGLVDELALAEALKQGRLAGAMLDVFEMEPLPAGSALADVPNLVLTPHIAGISQESNLRVSLVTAENVARALTANRSVEARD